MWTHYDLNEKQLLDGRAKSEPREQCVLNHIYKPSQKKILARNKGISELKTTGILEVVEDFQGRLTQSPGQKTLLISL
jgi:hypothetical protein